METGKKKSEGFQRNLKNREKKNLKNCFSSVWSQVVLMQLTLPKLPTKGVQVLLREVISLPTKLLLE